MYLTQYTPRMRTARVKQEEETHQNNSKIVGKLKERNVGTKSKSQKQDLASAEDLMIQYDP